ncbi:hypothetical protein ZIOFF_042768 [Zingiber officinale]|uniref:Tuftelin interacting protein N-terminal domain-containing protein n=1 Tax=Zingiber officinale TaxID=94328 RepID=A0A8J5KZ22_ZINOF|nr:hypothetical protein ZIOFF_042768 [Zingiber officinale]
MNSQLNVLGCRAGLVFAQNLKLTQLARSGRIEEAIALFHGMITRNTVTYNSMISAYAKNGYVVDARILFDQMPRRNLVSWNTMVAGYLHNDCFSEAAELFERMPRKDSYSWTLIITCCTRNGELDKARFLFDRMPVEKSSACYNAMISGYAKGRRYKDAIELLYSMPNKDFVSWNSVLSGYIHNGDMVMGLKFFHQMPERDVVSWNLVVEGLVKAGDLVTASEFFKRITSPNVVSWVTLLNGYCKKGCIVEAREIFDKMPKKNVVSWNAMIAGYVQHLQVEEAHRLFTEMPERNAVSWTTMISGYVRIGRLNEARNLLDMMPIKNVAAQTAMINGYVQSMRMNEAHQVFREISVRDSVCWNTMISGYVQCSRMDEALKMFMNMPKKDIVSWNTMIAGYAQDGQMDKAIDLFHQMPKKNTVSWNSVISGFNQNGLFIEAIRHFWLMRKLGCDPDWSTFASALSGCANLAALLVGMQLHSLLLKSGHDNDFFAGNALITMYARCGRISAAQQVFDEMISVDLVSWNSLIAGYASNGSGGTVISIFQEMTHKGVAPDEVTFVGVLSACSHAGMVDEGLKFFYSMSKDYSITPVAEHYACMVDLLGRAGRLAEAVKLVMTMPIRSSAGIWGALLSACRLHKNPELANLAANKLFEFEPHTTSNYVLLSNIHAEAGRWNEVERVRVLMKQRGVHKQTAHSWIEIKNEVCVFSSDDSGQPVSAEVFTVLSALSSQMRNIGHKSNYPLVGRYVNILGKFAMRGRVLAMSISPGFASTEPTSCSPWPTTTRAASGLAESLHLRRLRYGASDSDTDEGGRRSRKRRKGDLISKPVQFVSTGTVMPSQEIKRDPREEGDRSAGVPNSGQGLGYGLGFQSSGKETEGVVDEDEDLFLPMAFGRKIKKRGTTLGEGERVGEGGIEVCQEAFWEKRCIWRRRNREWYIGWKCLLHAKLLSNERIRFLLSLGLDMMNQAVEGMEVVQPGARENASFLRTTEKRQFEAQQQAPAYDSVM